MSYEGVIWACFGVQCVVLYLFMCLLRVLRYSSGVPSGQKTSKSHATRHKTSVLLELRGGGVGVPMLHAHS
jgi:hypothetical protein